jgi:hypothetical protein
MPKQAAVVSCSVSIRVIDIDIYHVSGEGVVQAQPTGIPCTEELQERAVNRIVLVVVMGYDWRRPVVIRRLVVRVDFAVVAPPVLVDGFTPSEEAVAPLQGVSQQFLQARVWVFLGG